MLTNDNFFNGVMNVTESWRFTPDSVNLAVMPMFHIAGVGLVDGRAVPRLPDGRCCRDVDPARILEADPRVRRHQRVLRAGGDPVPADDPGRRDDRLLRRLRAIVYGASPITDAVLTPGDGDVRLRVHPGVRPHRDDRRDHPARPRRPRPGRQSEAAALVRQAVPVGRDAHRRPARRATTCPTAGRRAVDPVAAEHDRATGRNDDATARPRSTTTAGSRPATPATSTRTASCSSTTG